MSEEFYESYTRTTKEVTPAVDYGYSSYSPSYRYDSRTSPYRSLSPGLSRPPPLESDYPVSPRYSSYRSTSPYSSSYGRTGGVTEYRSPDGREYRYESPTKTEYSYQSPDGNDYVYERSENGPDHQEYVYESSKTTTTPAYGSSSYGYSSPGYSSPTTYGGGYSAYSPTRYTSPYRSRLSSYTAPTYALTPYVGYSSYSSPAPVEEEYEEYHHTTTTTTEYY